MNIPVRCVVLCTQVKAFRDKIQQFINERPWSTMTKMGAVLAQGVLDAGGRNMALCLRSRAGFVKASAVVGMALFQQVCARCRDLGCGVLARMTARPCVLLSHSTGTGTRTCTSCRCRWLPPASLA